MPLEPERDQAYAWSWFSYHAGQRLTAFNFFVVALGAIIVGYAQAAVSHLSPLGVALGVVGLLISIAFWAMDVRNTELVICGRAALDMLEGLTSLTIRADDRDRVWLRGSLQGPIERRIFDRISRGADLRSTSYRLYTHSFWLRNVLMAVGILSAAAAIWAGAGFPGAARTSASRTVVVCDLERAAVCDMNRSLVLRVSP